MSNRVKISTFHDKEKNLMYTYYSDGSSSVQNLNKVNIHNNEEVQPKIISKQTIQSEVPPVSRLMNTVVKQQQDVKQPTQFSNIAIPSIISDQELAQDNLLGPLSVLLKINAETCVGILTDVFNQFRQLNTIWLGNLAKLVYICEDPFDYELFSNVYGLKTVRSIQDLEQGVAYKYINNTQHVLQDKSKFASFYTIVPDNPPTLCPIFNHDVFSIKVYLDSPKDITFPTLLNYKLDINYPYKKNININEKDTLKLLLMYLTNAEVNINRTLYSIIEKDLNDYRQYRPIEILFTYLNSETNNSRITLSNNFPIFGL